MSPTPYLCPVLQCRVHADVQVVVGSLCSEIDDIELGIDVHYFSSRRCDGEGGHAAVHKDIEGLDDGSVWRGL